MKKKIATINRNSIAAIKISKLNQSVEIIQHKIDGMEHDVAEYAEKCKNIPDKNILYDIIENKIHTQISKYNEFIECDIEDKFHKLMYKCKNAYDSSFNDEFEKFKTLIEYKIKNQFKSEAFHHRDLIECKINNKFYDIIDKYKKLSCSGSSSGTENDDALNRLKQSIDEYEDKIRRMYDEIERRFDALEKRAELTPLGVIMAFADIEAPEGWLACDGSAISRTDYAGLFKVIGTQFGDGDGLTTFNVPDLRGQFLRGYPGGELDPERSFASLQGDAIRNLKGQFGKTVFPDLMALYERNSNYGLVEPTAARLATFMNSPAISQATHNSIQDYPVELVFDASRIVPTAHENRPRNIALLFCIKARHELAHTPPSPCCFASEPVMD